MDINARLARRLHGLRLDRALSMEMLASRSGVSRSNISLIERGQSSPTASVLDKLASALDVTLAALFEDGDPPAAPSPLARSDAQPQWTDPVSGYVRRNLSPASGSPLQLVEVHFPPGQRVAYDTVGRDSEVHQQVWMIEGTLQLTLGEEHWLLEAGDCLAMQLDRPVAFHNPGRGTARYLVALTQARRHA